MKTITILNSVKSGYFMLVAFVILLSGVTACSNEEFGIEIPEVKKEWTKQELIEQALSRMPQTRSGSNNVTAQMITISETVSIRCKASKSMIISWGTDTITTLPNVDSVYTFTYSDGYPSHAISIYASTEALQSLNVDRNRLISLEIDASNLKTLYCQENYLDELDLAKCPALMTILADNNELSSINIDSLTRLRVVRLSHNRLTQIDVSKNKFIYALCVDDNQLTDIDLTKNPDLLLLYIGKNSITNLNLSSNYRLQNISLNHLPLETYNGSPVNTENFNKFNIHRLSQLDIAYTPFTSLDLSQKSVRELDISGTAITHLNLSRSSIETFYATRSKLAELTYSTTTFNNAQDIRIERTPLENEWEKINALANALPFRSEATPGTLFTYSKYMKTIYEWLYGKNWIINP